MISVRNRHLLGPAPAKNSVQSPRILVVEDSPVDATLVLAMLKAELPDAVVRVARNLTDAIEAINATGLDVVVTDLTLPDSTGLESLWEIRRGRGELVVIVMTSSQDRALGVKALASGADDFLVKGSHDARGLATAIFYAIARRRFDGDTRRYQQLASELLESIDANTCAVDSEGVLIAINRAWTAFAEENGAEAGWTGLGTSYIDVCDGTEGLDGAHAQEVSIGLRAVLAGELPRFEAEYPFNGPQGLRWMSLRINPMPSGGAVVSHIDVTTTINAQLALIHQTLHDPLTGLANRTLLEDRLGQALHQSSSNESRVGVALLDLDAFKRINDSLGHAEGDLLLRMVAQRLQSVVREWDTVSRIAADEFVVLLPGLFSESEAEELSTAILRTFAEPFTLTTAMVTVSASLGIVLGDATNTADDLLIAADAAMYDAKRHGRGRIRAFNSTPTRDNRGDVRLEAELRAALVRDELELHYQPVIDLELGTVTGVEALVRWRSPAGMRMPDTFIPVAEASGLIVDVGAWVINEACRQSAEWSEQGLNLDMAINLSARQVSHPDLVPTLREALSRHGVPPSRLVAEVTESTVVEDADAAQVALLQMAEMGVRVAIDDFGTGYSSLLYLKRYPVHAVKVDRSFVAGMGCNDSDDAIVASIVALARAVGAVCIAEGVETREQQASLVSLGCKQVQGYLFSRPVPADVLVQAINSCNVILAVPVPRRTADAPVRPAAAGADVLQQIAAAVTTSADLEGRARPLLEALQAVTGMATTFVSSIDEESGVQELVYVHNTSPDLQITEGLRMDWADTLCRRALVEELPVNVDIPGSWADVAAARAAGLVTYLGVPFRDADGKLLGTLCAIDTVTHADAARHVPVMILFADLLAVGRLVPVAAN